MRHNLYTVQLCLRVWIFNILILLVFSGTVAFLFKLFSFALFSNPSSLTTLLSSSLAGPTSLGSWGTYPPWPHSLFTPSTPLHKLFILCLSWPHFLCPGHFMILSAIDAAQQPPSITWLVGWFGVCWQLGFSVSVRKKPETSVLQFPSHLLAMVTDSESPGQGQCLDSPVECCLCSGEETRRWKG